MNELFPDEIWIKASKEKIINKINLLILMHKEGVLGGKIMPEDYNPNIPKSSPDNYHFFTLPMALNYQRNSYKLWPAATDAYNSTEGRTVFVPKMVNNLSTKELRDILIKFKIALQPIKHVEIWQRISNSICDLYDGDIKNLFILSNGKVGAIKEQIQIKHKKKFPYLSGNKIFNYWLYVMEGYTDIKLTDRQLINVAPDTHVLQASIRLGVIDPKESNNPKLREMVSNAWFEILNGTGIFPIDIHTPLWLWSRGGFPTIK